MYDSLVSDHDLERVDYLSKGNAGVLLPCFEIFRGVDEDDEVFGLALIVYLGDVVTARHVGQLNCSD